MGFKTYLSTVKTILLTLVVIISFIFSSLGWRHIELDGGSKIAVAAAILAIVYILMIFELVNRNLAAMIGAVASIAAHDCLVEYTDMAEIIQWLDLETLSLLFGMMIMVNVLSQTGLFNYLAIWSYNKSQGRFWLLITIMSFITAFLSAFIDNVSTMLLMSPTLIKLSELEHIDPRYILMIMVIFSNIGGCATPVGDPPNLIIIGDSLVSSLGITFSSFVLVCGPCVLITMVVIMIYLRLLYKSKESFRLAKVGHEPIEPLKFINGKDAALEIVELPKDPHEELKLMESIQAQINEFESKLTTELTVNLKRDIDTSIESLRSKLRWQQSRMDLALPSETSNGRRGSRLTQSEINQLFKTFAISSKPLLTISLVTLVVTIFLFFIQSLPGTNLTLGWVSLFASLLLLVMSSSIDIKKPDQDEGEEQEPEATNGNQGREMAANHGHAKDDDEDSGVSFEKVIKDVEWSTLIFFFALFIVMEVMTKLGLISLMGHKIIDLVDLIPPGQMRSIGAITIILWASGIASSIIDNVPFTTMMIKILGTMIEEQARAVSVSNADVMKLTPLVYALAFGSCFGGNGSLIGASANLVTAGIAGKHGYTITFNGFFKFTAPITLITLIVANIYLVLIFVIFDFR